MKIGAMVSTIDGIGRVSGVVPGSRQFGGETVQQAVVETSSSRFLPQDRVSLSEEARQRLEEQQPSANNAMGRIVNTPQGPSTVIGVLPDGEQAVTRPLAPTGLADTQTSMQNVSAAPSAGNERLEVKAVLREGEMSADTRQALQELQSIDRAVKAEEQTHAAVAGAYGSTPEYMYTRGPDGKMYAIGGSVQVNTASAATPEQAEQAAGKAAAAAISVNTPSSADFSAAAQAAQTRNDNASITNAPQTSLLAPADEEQRTAAPVREEEDRTADPMQALRETAQASYNAWNQKSAGARLDIAA